MAEIKITRFGRPKKISKLTDRERVMLYFLSHGLTMREVGLAMNTSETNIKMNMSRCYDKFNVNSLIGLLVALNRIQFVGMCPEQDKEQADKWITKLRDKK